MQMEINELKTKIEKGRRALLAADYIYDLLEKYKTEAFRVMGEGRYIKHLPGRVYIMKQIKADIERDIAHAEDAKKVLMEMHDIATGNA